MKTPLLIVLLGLCLAGPLFAANSATTETAAQPQRLSVADLDTLAGPIALYPDALVGIILPASTYSTDIVLAARFLENGGTQEQVDAQNWDQSVRSLAHYPEVLKWMNENLEWTQQLGVTFVVQPDDVMASIQRLRARAQALGNLKTTEQLTVVSEPDYIRIVPTYVEHIYVPYYDPAVIYVSPYSWWFGAAWVSGPWLRFDCNWVGRSIWFGSWSPSYFHRPAWRIINNRPPPGYFVDRHTWRPDMNRWHARPHPPGPRPGNIVRPHKFGWDRDHNRPGSRPSNFADGNNDRRTPPKAGSSRQPGGPGKDQVRPPRQGQPPSRSSSGSKSSLTGTPPSQGSAPSVGNPPRQRDGSNNRRPAVNNGASQVRPEQRATRGNASGQTVTRPPSGDRVQRTHTPPPSTNARPARTPASSDNSKAAPTPPAARATRSEPASSSSTTTSSPSTRASSSSDSSGNSSSATRSSSSSSESRATSQSSTRSESRGSDSGSSRSSGRGQR